MCDLLKKVYGGDSPVGEKNRDGVYALPWSIISER